MVIRKQWYFYEPSLIGALALVNNSDAYLIYSFYPHFQKKNTEYYYPNLNTLEQLYSINNHSIIITNKTEL